MGLLQDDRFGTAVDMNASGDRIVVGAELSDADSQ